MSHTKLYTTLLVLLPILVILTGGCSGGQEWSARSAGTEAQAKPAPDLGALPTGYQVSATGGMPATGPGARFNHCERIWCLTHQENFHIEHFVHGHDGWILHDDAAGDIYSPAGRSGGPKFPSAKSTVLRLCSAEHIHPFLLGIGSGFGPVRGGYYSDAIGYSRGHWRAFGTQIDSCCVNGMGWDYIHSKGVGRFFRFHDLEEYRTHPDRGWQKPFTGS